MTFFAYINGYGVDALECSEEEWLTLKRDKPDVKLPMCNCEGCLKTSHLGTPFFSHISINDCNHKGESAEHWYLKNKIGYECRKLGWDATVDEGQKIKPDVLAEKYGTQIAFEVQLSQITHAELIEKSRMYQKQQIQVVWIFHKIPINSKLLLPIFFCDSSYPLSNPPYPNNLEEFYSQVHLFQKSGIISSILIQVEEKPVFFLKTLFEKKHPLQDFVHAILSGQCIQEFEEVRKCLERENEKYNLFLRQESQKRAIWQQKQQETELLKKVQSEEDRKKRVEWRQNREIALNPTMKTLFNRANKLINALQNRNIDDLNYGGRTINVKRFLGDVQSMTYKGTAGSLYPSIQWSNNEEDPIVFIHYVMSLIEKRIEKSSDNRNP